MRRRRASRWARCSTKARAVAGLVVIRCSTPVALALRREGRRGAEGRRTRTSRSALSAPRSRSTRMTVLTASSAVDFVAREEFDFTIKVSPPKASTPFSEIERAELPATPSRRRRCTTAPAPCSKTWTSYRSSPMSTSATTDRRLMVSAILKHPLTCRFMPTGHGCKSRCTFFDLSNRKRSAAIAIEAAASSMLIEEIRPGEGLRPQVKEFFFDDDTFTDNLPRAEAYRPGAGQARRHAVVQHEGQCAARTAIKCCATARCGSCSSAMKAAASRSSTTSRRARPGHSPCAAHFRKDCHELGITIHRHLHSRSAGESGRSRNRLPLTPAAHDPGIAGRLRLSSFIAQAVENGWLDNDFHAGR